MTGTHQPPFTFREESVGIRCLLRGLEQVPELSHPQDPKHSLAGVFLLCSTVGLLLQPTFV